MKPSNFVKLTALIMLALRTKGRAMKESRFGKIVFIPGPRNGRYPYCNSLYIDDEIRVIIDPGSDEDRLRKLAQEGPVDKVIHSHYHEDHMTFSFLFPEAGLCAHKSESYCYQDIGHVMDCYGLAGTVYERAWRKIILETFHYKPRKPSLEFVDGSVLEFGDTVMEVIHTPGHSKGHCCFYFPDEGVLYLGDLDMTRFGPWYGDRVSDIDETIASVGRILTIPARIFISAHESGIMEGDITERAEAYLTVISKREERLLAYLDEPRTLEDIVKQWIVYKKPREPRHFFEFGERALMIKHLERLEKKGMLKKEGRRYFLI
jgi:hydroxyacylglutathione hydrolase